MKFSTKLPVVAMSGLLMVASATEARPTQGAPRPGRRRPGGPPRSRNAEPGRGRRRDGRGQADHGKRRAPRRT